MSTRKPKAPGERRVVKLEQASIEFHVVRGDRARARLVVRPGGQVEVRVPKEASDDWIDDVVKRRRRWILRQQVYFEQFRPREPERRYVNGETVRYLGRQYTLRIRKHGQGKAHLKGRYLEVCVRPSDDLEVVRDAVQAWYRSRAEEVIARRAEPCLALMHAHGIEAPTIRLLRMTRRWGSCTGKGHVLLNPYLVIAPTDCVDYVLVHELCHVRHPRHDEAFYRLLTTVMPDWPRRRRRLEKYGPFLTL
ncbi:MAG: M48 family metallopeptidase [Phycisphaerae bacterium]|nr:M48 family metallopeptidase [Phycisphaerae bacterium]